MAATTPLQITGIVLLVLGCLFVLAGLIRFCADSYLQFRQPEVKKGFGSDDVGKLADLVNALTKLPPWALSAVIGVILIAVGGYMSEGHALTP